MGPPRRGRNTQRRDDHVTKPLVNMSREVAAATATTATERRRGGTRGRRRAWTLVRMSRPELTAPADVFYSHTEARKYTQSSRVIEIQERLTERAVELLNFPDDGSCRLILDVGCGSGLSGDRLTELGHQWIGIDLSEAMLEHAREREVEGDVTRNDMGHGVPFRPGVFDGCVSISAVQWLCNADNSAHIPQRRLKTFFTQLYKCLKRGAKAVLQIYPDGPRQAEMITTAALRVGFSGGLVVDYPNSTRAKKYFLVLAAGPPESLPRAKGEDDDEDDYERRGMRMDGRKSDKGAKYRKSKNHKGKAWVMKKKEQYRNRGVHVANDSKFTGRKRKDRL